jgi:malate dehydrogenase (oxaloacetate-decarboxylating)
MHVPDRQPYCDFRMTVRVEIPHQPGQFARLATALAQENANLGAIDIVEVKRDRMVRDITFHTQSEAHATCATSDKVVRLKGGNE